MKMMLEVGLVLVVSALVLERLIYILQRSKHGGVLMAFIFVWSWIALTLSALALVLL